MTQIEQDAAAGIWVPMYYGWRFKVCRLAGRTKSQEEKEQKFRTLAEAQAHCDRLNNNTLPEKTHVR